SRDGAPTPRPKGTARGTVTGMRYPSRRRAVHQVRDVTAAVTSSRSDDAQLRCVIDRLRETACTSDNGLATVSHILSETAEGVRGSPDPARTLPRSSPRTHPTPR